MNPPSWLFRKGVTSRGFQFAVLCGILMTLGGAAALYYDFELLAGGRITPSWISFAVDFLFIILGSTYTVTAWRQLRQGK
ncbi:hypothetical protein [Deinococcus altitudinis]|uniref:hypothetical protein n=1 Tax=Deinococcus altitudinis TaxID=468914 RepID=UPI003891493C